MHTFSLLEGEEGDRELLSHTHPPAHRNPSPASRYDLVVIGAGPAGLVAAAGAAAMGARVALVERDRLGGDCLNTGCVPSKALLACARVAADARSAGRFGVRTGEVTVDFPAVMERMRRLRGRLGAHDSVERFERLGVSIFLGAAVFRSDHEVDVDGARLRFRRAIVATGSRAAIPDIPGLDTVRYLTNETVFSLTQLPARLAVIGGGPVGCEMAQAFARFGSRVTIVASSARLLDKDDEDAGALLARVLVRDGVRVITGTKLQKVRAEGTGAVLDLMSGTRSESLEVDAILVATGRSPNVEELGLGAAGVELDEHQGIRVDDHLRTTNARVFSAGDVSFRYRFTHVADALARIALQNALFFPWARASGLVIPWCTYTDPEIAHVGLTLAQAREDGVELDTLVQPLDGVDRAVLEDETDGFLKLHLARGTDRILGATLVARHAGETIGEIALAMTTGALLSAIGRTIHPYPTQAEILRKVADEKARQRLTPFVRRVMGWWFALTR